MVKGDFGFFPLPCYLTPRRNRRALGRPPSPGNAGTNTAADHFEMLQLALEQLPEGDLDQEILARANIGGRTHAFTADCREADIRFSVSYEMDGQVREGIDALAEYLCQVVQLSTSGDNID